MQLSLARQPINLKQTLVEAHRAKLHGRYGRAIILYQFAQSHAPDSAEIASRLAPLLAHEGRNFEAWRQFQHAGRALVRENHAEWGLSVFYEATRMLPMECDAWRLCASLEKRLGRREHALETLLEGRRQFRSPLHRDQAMSLLELARKIEPWAPDIVTDLAGLLSQSGQHERAQHMLEVLLERCPEDEMSRVLATRSRITWAPTHLWSWAENHLRELMRPRATRLRERFGSSH